jgi:mannose-6-phosphate isomerase-like protein (cupin superfamily)
VKAKVGVSLTIPVGTHFQFRNAEAVPLRFIIATIPPWPGSDEAVRVEDRWPA